MLRSSGPNGSADASWSAMCSSEPWVCTTPFGRPVLPLVRKMHAGSPGSGRGSGPRALVREARAAARRRSPSRTSAPTSPAIAATAPTCASCSRISETSSIALSGTATAPARITPK